MLKVIGVLTILAALVLTVGFFAGWFTLGSETHAGETQVRLGIDSEEFKGDVGEIKNRLNGDGSSAPDGVVTPGPAGTLAAVTLTGEVVHVAAPESTLTLRLSTGEERTLAVAAAATSELTQIRVGDRVEVETVVEGGRTRIVELKVL